MGWTHCVHPVTPQMSALHVSKATFPIPILHFSNVLLVQMAACCAPAPSHAVNVTAMDSTWNKAIAGLASLDVPNALRKTRVKNVKISILQSKETVLF